ncbi:MAG: FAD:protein FMN transferase [Phycisphaerales bacterium]|nr:FAD:protein FMN transferase [Phycisphaerales bacterium]
MICKNSFIAALTLALGACGAAAPSWDSSRVRHEFREMAMGTECRVVLYSESAATAIALARTAFARIHELDEALSDWVASSPVRQLPSGRGERVGVGADLATALLTSLQIALLTDGRFDPTVGPVVRLWRQARADGQVPPEPQLAAARGCVGYQYVKFDPQCRTISFDRDGMALDFGGIAKGMAAADALGVLRCHGQCDSLVAVGGDLAIGAAPPGATGWSVVIDDGLSQPQTLLLSECCVSTSGDREQWALIDGVRRGHIIDPATGFPPLERRAGCVIAPWLAGDPPSLLIRRGAEADAVASALCVAGASEGELVLRGFPHLLARVSIGHEVDTVQCISWGIPCDNTP